MPAATVLRAFVLIGLVSTTAACQGASWAPYAQNGYNGYNGYGYNNYAPSWQGNQNFGPQQPQIVPAMGYNPRLKLCDNGANGLWDAQSPGQCFGQNQDYMQKQQERLNPYGYNGFSGYNPNGF